MKPLILIFGANGQLGFDITQVIIPHYTIQAVTREIVDLANSQAVDSFLKTLHNMEIYAVINCVAFTNVDGNESNIEQAFHINSIFVSQLVNFCKTTNTLLVHFSTDYIFDGTAKNHKYNETDPVNPLNIYGLSKYTADNIIKNYLDRYYIFRVSSLFGVTHATGKQGSGFIPTMLRLAAERDSWTVISDQISCPTHTLDVAKVVYHFLTTQITEYGIYNCVSSTSCSWFEFAQLILREYGYDPEKIKPISYQDYKFIAKRPQYSVLDISKLSNYYQMPSYQDAFLEYKNLPRSPSENFI